MRPVVADVAWSASVCLLDTTVSPTKTDELTVMPFGLWTLVGPRNHVIGGARISPGKGEFWGCSSPIEMTV